MPIRTVLLVDDDDDIRKVAALALSRQRPWRVLAAASGREALELAERERPDVILLDMSMPGTDGKGVLLALRALPATQKTPVIFVTAHATKDSGADFLMLGAQGVIAKPFAPKKLAERIEHLVLRAELTEKAPEGPPAAADALAHALTDARDTFVRGLPKKLADLEGALAVIDSGPAQPGARDDACTRAHKLAGSAGTHGLVELSEAARRLEDFLCALPEGAPLDARARGRLAEVCAFLREAAAQAGATPRGPSW